MKNKYIVAIIGLALAGCGGSSNDSNTNNEGIQAPTQTKTKQIKGTIEQVNKNGTIIVNGESYRVNHVQYSTETLPTSVLAPNMSVQLLTSNTKIKDVNVILEPTIAGEIDSIDNEKKTFSINGFLLNFDGLTTDIQPKDWVMVSTLPTANAGYKVVSVTKFDVKETYPNLAHHYKIEGRISSIQSNNQTFIIGSSARVFYGNALELPQNGLRIGQWVEVEGEMNGDTFHALEVDIEDYDGYEGDNEIEGIITWVSADYSKFTLNYRGNFLVNSNTHFVGGTRQHLKQGVEVEVTSRQQTSGRLAIEVEFDTPDSDNAWNGKTFECSGVASNYDDNADTFEMTHCENGFDATISNQVFIDAMTNFKHLTPSQLNGSRIEVEGVIIDNKNIAQEIKSDDDLI
ncbi:TPA: hypothetical protein KD868_003631 [Vibrio parahaemolyticus]|nr:hypothetical protein [Vibrio parahaemolyticus]